MLGYANFVVSKELNAPAGGGCWQNKTQSGQLCRQKTVDIANLLSLGLSFFAHIFCHKLAVAEQREGPNRSQNPPFLRLTGIKTGKTVLIPAIFCLMRHPFFVVLGLTTPVSVVFLRGKSRFVPFVTLFLTKFVTIDRQF